ncbi:MAG: methyltransferase domain-containing protein [Candidatus Omnitrophica bacterium]|nr:methyltransferase domain-containing protein [Candidatus Omnitrophota bacterium]
MIKSLKRRLKLLYYSGNKFECPCCGGRLRKFLAHKQSSFIKGRLTDYSAKNEICPVCYSYSRHRFLLAFLKNHTDTLKARLKLLHFAPEPGIGLFLKKQRNIEYISCDYDPSKYPGTIKVDCTQMQFPDNTFDAVIISHVLEHIQEDVKALKELYRIIKPGGWATIAVPIYGDKTYEDSSLDHGGREKMYAWPDHVRLNGLDFKSKLTSAGFNTYIYTYADVPGKYIDREVQSPLLEDNKYIFFCRKD